MSTCRFCGTELVVGVNQSPARASNWIHECHDCHRKAQREDYLARKADPEYRRRLQESRARYQERVRGDPEWRKRRKEQQRIWDQNRDRTKVRAKNARRLQFRQSDGSFRRVVLDKDIAHLRAQPCDACGKTPAGSVHHVRYGDDPMLHTVPLCRSCHMKIHWALRRSGKG